MVGYGYFLELANMLQNTRLQRNRRRSARSDDNMNDSCVKITIMKYFSSIKAYCQLVSAKFC